jgi:hypothetical protein
MLRSLIDPPAHTMRAPLFDITKQGFCAVEPPASGDVPNAPSRLARDPAFMRPARRLGGENVAETAAREAPPKEALAKWQLARWARAG